MAPAPDMIAGPTPLVDRKRKLQGAGVQGGLQADRPGAENGDANCGFGHEITESCQLSVVGCQVVWRLASATIKFKPTTDNRQLTTDNWQLATDNYPTTLCKCR